MPPPRSLGALALVVAVSLVAAGCGHAPEASSRSRAEAHPHDPGTPLRAPGLTGLYGQLPPASRPLPGGTISVGILDGSAPTWATPIVPASRYSPSELARYVDLYDQPLYWSPDGATQAIDDSLSIAAPPSYSDGDRRVTLDLKPWEWSDGQPVTAAQVVDYIDVVKAAVRRSPASYGAYQPGLFPDDVTSASAAGRTLTLRLRQAYNPVFFTDDQLTLLTALPPPWAVDRIGGPTLDPTKPAQAARIAGFLAAQAGRVESFGTNPLWKVSDGPLIPARFDAATGTYTMVRNRRYPAAERVPFDRLVVTAYADQQALDAALVAGRIDMGPVDLEDLPATGPLVRATHMFGLPSSGFQAILLDFGDATGGADHLLAQRYLRQALAHLVDERADIRTILHGAGQPAYGPVPPVPPTAFAPVGASRAPYPFDAAAAAALLSSHGWKVVPGGQSTCVLAARCGPGIAKGTKLALDLVYTDNPPYLGEESLALAAAAAKVGFRIAVRAEPFDQVVADPGHWALLDLGGFTGALYPTTDGIFDAGGPLNDGAYDSPAANAAIHASVYGADPAAVSREAAFLSQDLPALFLPDPDTVVAVRDGFGGTRSALLALTQGIWTPQGWYRTSS